MSAVCTSPDHRGRGLGTRLMRAVAALIEARGERVFPHVKADNAAAVGLYDRLGFVTRTVFRLHRLRAPA